MITSFPMRAGLTNVAGLFILIKFYFDRSLRHRETVDIDAKTISLLTLHRRLTAVVQEEMESLAGFRFSRRTLKNHNNSGGKNKCGEKK